MPDRSPRILVIHRYYWPDTPPYASMLKEIVSHWVVNGFQVDVFSSQPSYKVAVKNEKVPKYEKLDGANVYRMNLPTEAGRPMVRLVNSVKLFFGVLIKVLFSRRYDVIMISTSPPVVAGLTGAIASKLKGSRFIYHCMDVHPEIGRLSGEFRQPLLFNLLQKIDSWSCRQANPVVVLSDDMRDAISSRPNVEGVRCKVINNFSLPEESQNEVLPFEIQSNKFTLLFAGNIGRFQGLDVLIDAFGRIKERSDIELILMGEGAARNNLEKKALELGANVRFVGHHAVAVAKKAMQQVSAGFISLIPEVSKYAYPSKTMTYLEQGCPILAALDKNSSLSRDIVSNNVGVVVHENDSITLAEAICNLADNPKRISEMKEQAALVGFNLFSPEVVLPAWNSLISKKNI